MVALSDLAQVEKVDETFKKERSDSFYRFISLCRVLPYSNS